MHSQTTSDRTGVDFDGGCVRSYDPNLARVILDRRAKAERGCKQGLSAIEEAARSSFKTTQANAEKELANVRKRRSALQQMIAADTSEAEIAVLNGTDYEPVRRRIDGNVAEDERLAGWECKLQEQINAIAASSERAATDALGREIEARYEKEAARKKAVQTKITKAVFAILPELAEAEAVLEALSSARTAFAKRTPLSPVERISQRKPGPVVWQPAGPAITRPAEAHETESGDDVLHPRTTNPGESELAKAYP